MRSDALDLDDVLEGGDLGDDLVELHVGGDEDAGMKKPFLFPFAVKMTLWE